MFKSTEQPETPIEITAFAQNQSQVIFIFFALNEEFNFSIQNVNSVLTSKLMDLSLVLFRE